MRFTSGYTVEVAMLADILLSSTGIKGYCEVEALSELHDFDNNDLKVVNMFQTISAFLRKLDESNRTLREADISLWNGEAGCQKRMAYVPSLPGDGAAVLRHRQEDYLVCSLKDLADARRQEMQSVTLTKEEVPALSQWVGKVYVSLAPRGWKLAHLIM